MSIATDRVVAFLTLSIVALPVTSIAQGSEVDRAAIRSTLDDLVQVAERGDADAYLDFITDDAFIIGSGGIEVSGREAIHQWVSEFFSAYSMKVADLKSLEVIVEGDLAIHRYTALAMLTPTGGGEQLRDLGKYLDVLRRGADGRWRMSHHTWIAE